MQRWDIPQRSPTGHTVFADRRQAVLFCSILLWFVLLKTVELKNQEENQEKKEAELNKRETKVLNLEIEKKLVAEREEEISNIRQLLKVKENDLKEREEILNQNQKKLEKAVIQFTSEREKADTFYESQKNIFEENETFMISFRNVRTIILFTCAFN